jgi:hypothetical protein
MRYRRGELAGIKKCRQGCLKKQKGEDESNRVWGARLYIANFEYRDFHLIGKPATFAISSGRAQKK